MESPKPEKHNSWYYILKWKENVFWHLNKSKRSILIRFFKRCPQCKSKRLQFVEGGLKQKRFLSKWFCRDCMSLHYKITCEHCNKSMWLLFGYKSHISKEYMLGKYGSEENWWKYYQRDYFLKMIEFHTEGKREWKRRLEKFDKSKNKRRIRY